MYKNELKIEYQQVEVCEDVDSRIFNALNMLINLDEIYEKKDNLQSFIQD